jgi:beta-glucosidase
MTLQAETQAKLSAYQDPARPVAERVQNLLSQMTLAEKVAQLGSVWVYELLDDLSFSEAKAETLLGQGIGQITRIGGASSLEPAASARLANSIQAFVIKHTRLGIPAMVHEECCSGYMARGATCFPQTIGLASTWAPELAEAMAAVVRTQMRAVGAHQGLSPVLDVTRDPRWGRTEETFGEDPYLTSCMGVAYVKGIHGPNLKEGILATGKHFVGYGMSEGGMNWAPVHLPERELREVFLRPFEVAVKEAQLASMMNAYHELDGVPCTSSRQLLTEILRQEWGFDGIVVSDYFSVDQLATYHRVACDKEEAALMALSAGIDVELPSTDCYGAPLYQAVQAGHIGEALVDQAAGRVLEMKFRLGLFERPYVDEGRVAQVFDSPDQRALARQIAQQSMVLLKNQADLLPLRADLAKIAVVGPNADNVRNLVGDYAYPCHIESLVELRHSHQGIFHTPVPDRVEMVDNFVPIISILEGIRRRISPQTQVLYARGCDVLDPSRDGLAEAVDAVQGADVAIVVVGDKAGLTDSCTSGETRDRAKLSLPGIQEDLVWAIHATGVPLVVVLVNGRPLALPWIAEHVPAILEAWLPGEEGAEAVADVLFGVCNPGGKLPMTFPRGVGQVPIYYGHKPSGGRSHWKGDYVELSSRPLFPFGHGLSYTRFEYANLHIEPARVSPDGQVTIAADVKNVGSRAGDEVVQLYVHDVAASVTRPVQELKGFQRVSLEPGEQVTVSFRLAMSCLGFYNRDMKMVVEPGAIEVMVGSSSADIHLSGSFEIEGQAAEVDPGQVFFSTATVTQVN